MADQRNNSENLTLSQVCDALNISARKVQYLREQGVVTPTVLGQGRGRPCLYTVDDVVRIWIAVIELDGMDYPLREKILSELGHSDEFDLGSFSTVSVDVSSVRKKIISLLQLTVR